MNFPLDIYKTPYYIVSEELLTKNLEILKSVKDRTGSKILLAQKAYSMYSTYPLIAEYLDGTTASGFFEAKLGNEEMGKENHIFATAYREEEFGEILGICDHIIFNSFTQWHKYKDRCLQVNKNCGLRINPEFSTQMKPIYDPCSKGSRLGITADKFHSEDLTGISGLHFHTLCEQGVEPLIKTLEICEEKFGDIISNMKWINFGGGHHITREDYNIDLLVNTINNFKQKYDVEIYLEPGEAVALNAGFMVASVLDIVSNSIDNAVLDVSPSCHMPDVIEMPYRPNIINSGDPNQKEFTYRLSGHTCLAGDIIGDYSFDNPLKIGDKLILCDMAIYSMVKNNTFNGVNLPSIVLLKTNGEQKLIREFGYSDFKCRL